MAGNVREVEPLVKTPALINAKDARGWTALMIAARENRPEILRLLLRHRADVNVRNKIGETALMHAANSDRIAIVQMLLDHGASVDTKNNAGWTALTYAAWKGHRLTVETLLSKGANARIRDKDGLTASVYAERQSTISLYDPQLRDPGTLPSRVGRLDAERLQLVKRRDYREIASLLKQAETKKTMCRRTQSNTQLVIHTKARGSHLARQLI